MANQAIAPFGKENIQHILEDTCFMVQCFERRAQGLLELVQRVHFDPNHPENCNVKVTDCKMPYIDIYNGSEWIKADKEDVLSQMATRAIKVLITYFEENKAVVLKTIEAHALNILLQMGL